MPRRAPYGTTPLDGLAFALALPVRRHVLRHAARTGRVTARDLLREYPEYDDRHNAADVLHVLRDLGLLRKSELVDDVTGTPRQLSYTLTATARQAIRELAAAVNELALEALNEPSD